LPISGLVVVFDSSVALDDRALEQLAEHPSITLGERGDDRIAIVIDTACKEQDIEVWDWLAKIPGVSEIKIAFVGFDD
jgi:nitrate reductase NapAB chaperone NapD